MHSPDKEKAAMQENRQAAYESEHTKLYQNSKSEQADTWSFDNCNPKGGRCFQCKQIRYVAFTPALPARKLCENCLHFWIEILRCYFDGGTEAEIKDRLFWILLADLNPYGFPIAPVDQQAVLSVIETMNKIHPGLYRWAKGRGGKL